MEIIFEIKGENNYEERFVGEIEIQDGCVAICRNGDYHYEINDYISETIFEKYKKLYLRFMYSNDFRMDSCEVRGNRLKTVRITYQCELIN